MAKRNQPQRLPPPLTHGGEAIGSQVILTENSGPLAVALWKTARTVRLWSAAGPGDRSRAYDESGLAKREELLDDPAIPEEIAGALHRAAGVFMKRTRANSVAIACREVSEWAAQRDRPHTAIEFMQAAAVAVPDDADLAQRVASLARSAGEYHRAETWYREGVSRGRRARSWAEFAKSYIGLGSIYALRGNAPQAHRNLLRGFRAARRFSLRPLAAEAGDELARLAIGRGRNRDITRFGRSAVEGYPAGDPRLRSLALALAAYLIDSGHFGAAERLIGAARNGGDELIEVSCRILLAGTRGDEPAFNGGMERADQLRGKPPQSVQSATAQLNIARGAARIGAVARAREACDEARQAANAAGSAPLVERAIALRQSIDEGTERTIEAKAESQVLESFVRNFVAALTR